jgi:hypothetical protein
MRQIRLKITSHFGINGHTGLRSNKRTIIKQFTSILSTIETTTPSTIMVATTCPSPNEGMK